MALLGGVSSPIGSTIGTGLLILIPEWLRFLKSVPGLYLAIYGVAVILIVAFMPEGIWGFVGRLFRTPRRAPSRSVEPLTLRPANSGAPVPLEVRGLPAKNFGGLKAVDGVSFRVRRGGVHALIGPNGSGKTTTLNVMTGLYRATAGEILIDGVDVTALPAHKRTVAGLARTFQNIRLFRSMTALENVVVGAERDGNALAEGGHDTLRRRARAALDFVGLGSRADETIPSFSYGHQRLIEIARALAANPTVLLLDEPAAGLNLSEKKALHDLLNSIAAQGLTILIIDHDMTLISGVARHLTVLNFGRRIADGETAEVLRQPDVVAAYLEVALRCSKSETSAFVSARSRLCTASRSRSTRAVVTLLGSNGAGKSTTLRAISGLVAPRAGSILFDGRAIAGLSPRAIVKLGVAHVPEGRRVFPGLTVRENIMLGASNGNASSAAIRREADAMFDVFPDIRHFADALGLDALGRPAANGRGRPRPDGQAPPVAARRALARPCARHRAGGIPDHRGDP